MSERRPPSHEGRILLLALLAPLPALALGLWLLWTGAHGSKLQWTLSAAVVVAWLGGALALRERVVRALQTVASLLGALREGDYAIRGRPARPLDALGEALAEVNSLADTLARQRTVEVEASALLAKVLAEIDVGIFAFEASTRDPGERRLRLVNPAGERLLEGAAAARVGASAGELGMTELLGGEAPRIIQAAREDRSGPLPGGFTLSPGQWELRRSAFRLEGLPHDLVVLTDLRRALREEERLAWQRLVRVLGHEINNSLAPIRSIAGNLRQILLQPAAPANDGQTPAPGGCPPADWQDDVARGLAVIERRSEALGRFMTSYARLARLPPPSFAPLEVGALVRRVVELEKRLPIELRGGPVITLLGDADQLEQLLINLVANAVEATLESGTLTGSRAPREGASESGESGASDASGPLVEVAWRTRGRSLEIQVVDQGPGLANPANLFVPFFTTKPNGSGIGLVLSRQIAEAHRGSLTLEGRPGGKGAVARLRLPL